MSKRILLLHVTVVGAERPSATVEFGDRLTVIHGASDTGKSHIFELINYAMGLAKAIEMPPEARGYQYVLLGLQTEEQGALTFVRDLAGGSVGLVEGDLREFPAGPAEVHMKANHTSTDPMSVSRFLLAQMDLDQQFVRQNQNNATKMLELRQVIRLAAVGEEKILSRNSPVEFGQHTARPGEAAIFRLFIEGSDDSGLIEIPKKEELKKIAASKVEVLETVITDLESKLTGVPPVEELRDQLVKLANSLRNATAHVESESAQRDKAVRERSQVTQRLIKVNERHDEVSDLLARFGLLQSQYESDLGRLDMLSQADDYFAGTGGLACPFCGSSPQHQHGSNVSGDGALDDSQFAIAVESEKRKIAVLRSDLKQTLDTLVSQEMELRSAREELRSLIGRGTELIRALDRDLQLPGGELDRMLKVKSTIEQQLQLHAHVEQLVEIRNSVSTVPTVKTSTDVPIAADDLGRFDQCAREILTAWAFPHNGSVYFSTSDRDLVVDNRTRRSRGKGVRSILHALFNVALAEYCLRFNLRHPGFVLLDSPIVTYRQPNEPAAFGEDETILTNVVDAFYSYLQNGFGGQSIILENKSPLAPLPQGSREYLFEGPDSGSGRKGFYPDVHSD